MCAEKEHAEMMKVIKNLDALKREIAGNSAHVRCPIPVLKRLAQQIEKYESLINFRRASPRTGAAAHPRNVELAS